MTSISSTFLLQVVTYPYVAYLFEQPSVGASDEPSQSLVATQSSDNIHNSPVGSRRFRAVRFNFLGNETSTTFNLSAADRNGVSNPFASFRLKREEEKQKSSGSDEFYVFGGGLKDLELQRALARPNECPS